MAAQMELSLRMGKIHAARLEGSARLQRTLAFLRSVNGDWRSTRDIILGAGICAVNSAIAELRANHISIETRCVGQGKYEYRLTP